MDSAIKKLVIGSAQFGQKYGISNNRGMVETKDVIAILDLAYKNGINTIDTAKGYGVSEIIIGNYIRQKKTLWKIISKYENYHEGKGIIQQIQESTDLLGTSLETILAHNVNLFLDPRFQYEVQQAKDRGLVKSVGVSIYSNKDIDLILASDLIPEIIQLPLNILDTRLYHKGSLKLLTEKKIHIHVRSVFLQGLFFLNPIKIEKKFKDVIPTLSKLQNIARNSGLTISELSLCWVASLDCVDKVIIGVENSKQLQSHLSLLKKPRKSLSFKEALSLKYQNKKILNPVLWPQI